MHVIILAAGFGTRLYPLTKSIPKSLLPICNKPVIEYILEKLKGLDIKKITVVTNDVYYPKFLDWLANYIPDYPLSLLSDGTSSETDKLGAVGDLKFVLEKEKM